MYFCWSVFAYVTIIKTTYLLTCKTGKTSLETSTVNSVDSTPFVHLLVRFPNSLGCELGERRSYSLWIELPGPIVQKKIIGSGKMGTELESSTQKLGILISQTFKTSLGSAAERHLSLPPVCHFFGRPDIREVFVFNKFRICEKLHFRFLPWFPDRFALNSGGNALKFILNQRNIDLSVRISIKKRPFSAFFT